MQPQQLWEHFENIGYETRINSLDGLETWKRIKSTLTDAKVGRQINLSIEQTIKRAYIVDDVDVKHENVLFTDVDRSLHETLSNKIEADHFFIQHFRIPLMEHFELSRRKFAQIAYNAGQFRAEREKLTYSNELIEYYDSNKLGKWDTYAQN